MTPPSAVEAAHPTPSARPAAPADERAVGIAFGILLLALWPTLVTFPSTWSASYQEHGFFIGGLVLWLLWRDRHRFFRGAESAATPALLPASAAISLAWLAAVVMNVRMVHQLLMVLLLTAWGFTVFGWSMRRRILAIALTFLLGLSVWGAIVPVLQRATVLASGGVTHLAGIDAFIGYDYITISTGTFLVEQGCAGINYLMGGLTLGAIYAHLFCPRWQTQLKIVALAGAASIVGNWIRVAVLVVIGEASAMQSDLIADHLWQGWAIFTLLMIPTYFVAQRLEARDRALAPTRPPPPVGWTPDRTRAAFVATAWAAVGPALFMAVGAIPRGGDIDRDIDTLGLGSAAGQATLADAPEWSPHYVGVDERTTWRVRAGVPVEVGRHYYVDQRQGDELVQWDNVIAPDSLLVSDRLIGPVGRDRRFVREALVREPEHPRVVWYWYRVAGFDTPFASKAKLLEMLAFLRRYPAAELVTLTAPCDAESCMGAAEALRAVLGEPIS